MNSISKTGVIEWHTVPATPDQAMCQAGQDKAREWPKFPLRIVPIYQAMLAAAPAAPDKGEPSRDAQADPTADARDAKRYRLVRMLSALASRGTFHSAAEYDTYIDGAISALDKIDRGWL